LILAIWAREVLRPAKKKRKIENTCSGFQRVSKGHAPILFDYFFLTQGANDEFLRIDHIYPEEFPDILEASDHIPIVLDLAEEWS